MDNKKITLKQTVTDKDGNQQIKTISTYTDEAILASETNINEKISNLETNVETNTSKISNLETNVETNTSKISENTAEIENLKAQGSTVSLLPLKQIIKNGTYSAVDDNVDGYAKVAVNIPSYPFVVTDVGTYYPKDGYLFDSVTLPDIPIKNAFQTIGYTEIPETFNASIEYSKELASKWDPSNTSVGNIFKSDNKLVFAPKIDTSNVKDTYYMFYDCRALISVPAFDTSKVTSMGYMFSYCIALTSVPAFDTSNVTSMSNMFYECSSLTSVPAFDTSNVTSMYYMFYRCKSLTSVPLFNTSNVTDMNNMFRECKALTSVPAFDTSKVTNMSDMFSYCVSLTSVPAFDTSKVTNMSSMFSNCIALTSVPAFDTSKVTSMGYMFYTCESLTSVPLFNTSNVTDMSNMFIYCGSLTSVPAFNTSNVTDMYNMFGACRKLSLILMTDTKCSFNIRDTALGHDALVTLLNNLGTANSGVTLTMGSSKLALLSDEEKKIATDKGWTLA